MTTTPHNIICRLFPPACNVGGGGNGSPVLRQLADSIRDAPDEEQALLLANAFVKALAAEGELQAALSITQELQKLVPPDRFARASESYLIEADLQTQLGNSDAADLALRLSENLINSERLRINLVNRR